MNLLEDEGWIERADRWEVRPPASSGVGSGSPGSISGDCILFPSGPAGAHQIINRSREPVRVLLVSNFAMPRGAVQVDSDKLMIRWGPDPEDSLWFRREDAVDYWEGE